MHDGAVSEVGEQLGGARQGPALGQEALEDLAVAVLERARLLLAELAADLPAHGAGEEAAAHADAAVDPPAVDDDPALHERALPGEDVRVDRVDEGPVEVEDERGHGADSIQA